MRDGRQYTFIDYATQGYLGLVGLIVLVWHGRTVRSWPLLLAAHVIGIGLIHALIRFHAARPDLRLLEILRHFYPVLLYGPLYHRLLHRHAPLNDRFVTDVIDSVLRGLVQ